MASVLVLFPNRSFFSLKKNFFIDFTSLFSVSHGMLSFKISRTPKIFSYVDYLFYDALLLFYALEFVPHRLNIT